MVMNIFRAMRRVIAYMKQKTNHKKEHPENKNELLEIKHLIRTNVQYVKRMKKTRRRQGEDICKTQMRGRLVSKIYEDLLKLSNRETKNAV